MKYLGIIEKALLRFPNKKQLQIDISSCLFH